MRLAPPYDSQDFADATRRAGFSAPRRRASSPTTKRGLAIPRQRRAARGEIELARDVEKRRQQRARRDLARAHELRDVLQVDAHRSSGCERVEPRERAVGRAEIDADDVTWCHRVV